MDELPQILQALRRTSRTPSSAGAGDSFFFQLRWSDKECFLLTVDAKGVEMEVDCRSSQGDARNVLRIYCEARKETYERLSWEEMGGEIVNGLSLSAHPGYMARLERLIATDPELRSCCLRVEGRRVAIRPADFPAVRKRLLKAGFFV